MTSPGRDTTPFQILLIEDTLDQALHLRTLLESELSCRVTLAQDGIRGGQLAENQEWDLVITDLNLPGRDGVQLIRASKELHPEMPIIATTAYTGLDYAERAQEAGVDALLEKPLEREELLEEARRLLGISGPGEAPNETAAAPEPAVPARTETVLAIGALPGDVELGCGGILLRHRDRGHRVVILHITAGGEGSDPGDKSDAQESAQVLGAHLVIGEAFEEEVPDPQDMMTLVERTVEDFQPTTVYVPSPHDVRESRLNTHRAADLGAANVPNFYCYQAPTTNMEFEPTLFVDVTDYMDTKLAALRHYRAQVVGRPHLDPEFVRSNARYWGRFLGYGEAEPLEVVRGRGSK